MLITNDPGPWQYYVNRPDNVGLPIMEIKDKYMREQLLFEQNLNFIQQQMIMSNSSSGGGVQNPNSNLILNPLVETFVNDGGITDPTQRLALNNLINYIQPKPYYSKLKIIYPMVGETALAHSFNLVNTSTYQLTFTGGWVHNSLGALPNGTNTYADTQFNPYVEGFTNTNAHMSYYVTSPSTPQDGRMVGVSDGGDDQPIYIIHGYSIATGLYSLATGYGGNTTGPTARWTVSDTRGFTQLNRAGLTVENTFNGSIKGTDTQTLASVTNLSFYLGVGRILSYGNYKYTNKQCGFASFGDGLTTEEAADFNMAVQAFQTTLNRKV
jgi:hypothetical protein